MSGTRSSIPSSLLPDQIRQALHAGGQLWYPGLAASFIEAFEDKQRAEGWSRERYGTWRWMVGDAEAARLELGVVDAGSQEWIVEALPSGAGRDLAPLDESPAPKVAARIQGAVERVSIEDLAESIGWITRSCHVLAAEPGYDVSHSTPELPLSIFFSMPGTEERHAELRLVESIIHEAMHLQLTFIESSVPLVKPTGATAFSPWKQSERPVQGLLHGLYVFAVIHEALLALAAEDADACRYAEVRCPDIASEIAATGDARDSLTSDGLILWDELVSRVSASAQA
jgi:HEXXH motif-containing protein